MSTKKIPLLATTTAIATLIATAPGALAAVNQGDRILFTSDSTDKKYSCTAGFLDKATNTIVSAGHCILPGTTTVYDMDDTELGTAVNPHGERDIAYIQTDPENIGDNIYSGDNVSPVASGSQAGDLYMYSRQTDNVQKTEAGELSPHYPNQEIVYGAGDKKFYTEGGDSGGPVWDDDGIVAIHSGSMSEGSWRYATLYTPPEYDDDVEDDGSYSLEIIADDISDVIPKAEKNEEAKESVRDTGHNTIASDSTKIASEVEEDSTGDDVTDTPVEDHPVVDETPVDSDPVDKTPIDSTEVEDEKSGYDKALETIGDREIDWEATNNATNAIVLADEEDVSKPVDSAADFTADPVETEPVASDTDTETVPDGGYGNSHEWSFDTGEFGGYSATGEGVVTTTVIDNTFDLSGRGSVTGNTPDFSAQADGAFNFVANETGIESNGTLNTNIPGFEELGFDFGASF